MRFFNVLTVLMSIILLSSGISGSLMLGQNSLGDNLEISFFENVYADKEKEHEKHDVDKNKIRDELDDEIKKSKVGEKVRVIVETNNDTDDLIEQLDGKILYKYSIIDAVAIEIPAKNIHNLAQSQSVVFVDSDAIVSTLAQFTSWGISKINAQSAWTQSTGSGVHVAVLDTGIDPNHDDLSSNIAFGVAFDRGNIKFKVKDWQDKNGHGTHVAGTVAALDNNFGVVGVGPSTSLYAVRVLDSQGSGFLSDIIAGIEWSVKGPDGIMGNSDDADVISMSLGTTADISAFHDAVDAVYNNGVVIVAAAGNSGDGDSSTNEFSYPAAYGTVIAVGAIDINDNAPFWSNSGNYVELAAPGVSIISTYRGNNYAQLSGTSMATPHVSGVASLLLSLDPSLSPIEIRNILQTTATDLGPVGKDTVFGYGLVDAQKAVNSVSSPPTPDTTPPVIISNLIADPFELTLTDQYTEGCTATDASTIVACSVQSGSIDTSVLGTQSVTYTATDSSGNIATNVVTSTIQDTTVPTLTQDQADPQSIITGDLIPTLTVTVSDNNNLIDGTTVNCDTSAVDNNTAGSYAATCEYADPSGNPASTVTYTVDVTNVASSGSVTIFSHSETIKDKHGNKIFKSKVKANVSDTPNNVKYTYTFDSTLSLDKIKKAELKINKEKSDIRSLAVQSGNSIQFDLSSFSFSNGDSVKVKLEIIYQNVNSGTQYSFTVDFDPGDLDTTSAKAKIKSSTPTGTATPTFIPVDDDDNYNKDKHDKDD